jgi:hypothetical protein
MERARYLEHREKPNLRIRGVEEGEEIRTKVIDNIFNRITAQKFPNLEKERVKQVHEAWIKTQDPPICCLQGIHSY